MTTMWNQQNVASHANFVAAFARLCAANQAQGLVKYGDTFRGNPIMHLQEELADAVNYLHAIDKLFSQAFNLLMRCNNINKEGMERSDPNLEDDLEQFVKATLVSLKSFKEEVE